MPQEGGGLSIYNKEWTKDIPLDKEAESKGYIDISENAIHSIAYVTVIPKPGDIFIINTRNLHQVEDMDEQQTRLTCNSFFTIKDNLIKIWN